MTSPTADQAEAGQADVSATSRLTADHPGVNELFAVLAYGEVAAFYRLTDEARMAPDLRGRISMASMAAAEMNHYELLRDALDRRGVDVVTAMSKYVPALENYHRLTMPSTWLEALVKTYVGDALASDLYLELADGLPDQVADVVRGHFVGDRALAVRCRRSACGCGRQQQTAEPAGFVVSSSIRRSDHPGPVSVGRP